MEQLKKEAKKLGIQVTKIENGKRRALKLSELQKEINKEKDRIVNEYLKKSKKLISVCKILIQQTKSLSSNKPRKVNKKNSPVRLKVPPPPPPPPPPPTFLKKRNKPLNKKPSSPPKGFAAIINEIKRKVPRVNA